MSYSICSACLSLSCSHHSFTVSIISLWFQSSFPCFIMPDATKPQSNVSWLIKPCLTWHHHLPVSKDFICAHSLAQMHLPHIQYRYLRLIMKQFVWFYSLFDSEYTLFTNWCLWPRIIEQYFSFFSALSLLLSLPRINLSKQLPLRSFSHDLLHYYRCLEPSIT